MINWLSQLRTAPVSAKLGLGLIAAYAFIAIFAPLIAPHTEREIVGSAYLPWAAPFYLGTDAVGRDVMSRLIYGARNTVGIALATTLLAFLIGSSLGLLAATVGGWLDTGLSRIVDVLMAIPS
ncbi:ABC transporter permease, partial [Gemmobacter sp. con4]|nr:ABC transporter permease [Gemmobacter fulvus]